MVKVGGEKMAKSLGNFTTLGDALDGYGPRAFRLAVLQVHYREPMELTDNELGRGRGSASSGSTNLCRRAAAAGVDPPGAPLDEPTMVALPRRHGRRLRHSGRGGGDVRRGRRANAAIDGDDAPRAATLVAAVGELLGALGLDAGAAAAEPTTSEIDALVAARDAARAAKDSPRPTASVTSSPPAASRSRTRRPARPGTAREPARRRQAGAVPSAARVPRRRAGRGLPRGARAARAGRRRVRDRVDRGRRASRSPCSTRSRTSRPRAACACGTSIAERLMADARTEAPQGVIARAEPIAPASVDDLLARPDAFLVALDGVTDPGNLGAVLRTAETAGVTGVVLPRHRGALARPGGGEGRGGGGRARADRARWRASPACSSARRRAGVWTRRARRRRRRRRCSSSRWPTGPSCSCSGPRAGAWPA